MLRERSLQQRLFLEERFEALMSAAWLPFAQLKPSQLPAASGVYLISALIDRHEHAYYVGRSKNVQRRLYTNHLMGPFSNARLKKHLCAGGECADAAAAKAFIRASCGARWILQEGHRERGTIEGYVTGLLFPKYGIQEEH